MSRVAGQGLARLLSRVMRTYVLPHAPPSRSLPLFVYLQRPPFPSRRLASCRVVAQRLLLRLLACLSVAFIGIAPERQ